MKILDTNLWVFGTLRTNERAVRLLDGIERGETRSAISAYVVQEALEAFDRVDGLTPAERDEVQTLFLTRLTRMEGLIAAPTSRDIRDSLLDEYRSGTRTRLLARALDIQPKDVPIVVLAFEHVEREPTILTNDEAFAAFAPGSHSLEELSIEHVD